MFSVLLPIHIIVALLLIVVVLMQQSKGAGLSPVFGAGQSVFGAGGATPFLSKMTAVLAVLFMVTSILLAISPRFSSSHSDIEKELQKGLIPQETTPESPQPGTEPPVQEFPGGE
jgi:preprotein translocase subunit SecG